MADQEEQDSGEKEFEATEQKKKQAREDGDVVQSKETNALAAVLGILAAAYLIETFTGRLLFEQFTSLFSYAELFAFDAFESKGARLGEWLRTVLFTLLPILLILVIFTCLAVVLTRSFSFSAKKIKPDVKKLSPAENLKKKYGPKGLLDFAKDTAKMLFAGLIATLYLLQFARNYYGSSMIQEGQIAAFTSYQVVMLILYFALFQFLLAAIDFPLQWRLHADKLKMTREELKKETKQSEGDPLLKQQRRQKGAEIAKQGMMDAVKTATVVMVNPEHYAVALKWDQESQRAPVVVAKGVDHIAAKIREIAKEHNVPIYRDPPSTRSIYNLVDIDEEIQEIHFAAVATAIQYVQRILSEQS